jgi:hypothetical protein
VLLANVSSRLQYIDHQAGHGRAIFETACALSVEGIVSKRIDAPYAPGNRSLWRKVKCLHREEFVVVGWTDPEGARPWLGALLLAYYDPEGRLVYAGRAGAGIKQAEPLIRFFERSGATDLDAALIEANREATRGRFHRLPGGTETIVKAGPGAFVGLVEPDEDGSGVMTARTWLHQDQLREDKEQKLMVA